MDRDQLRALVMQELQPVYRMALHLALDPHDADDLVQQTYLNAFKAADKFELGSVGVRPWLFKILHNVFRSRQQQRGREPALIDDADAHACAAGEGPDAHAGLGDLNWDHVDERLKHAIHELPERLRMIFLLSAVEGCKYREIAEVMQMPMGTVMSALHRARRRLLKQLAALAAEQHLPHPRRETEQNRAVECSPET